MRDHRMPALRTIALMVFAAWSTAGHAAGLGPVRVQSALGEPLRASVPVLGDDTGQMSASCLKVSLTQTDGSPMMAVRAGVSSRGETYTIHLSTRQPVNEPAAVLHVAASCGASIQRSYQLLLDPVVILPQLAQAPQGWQRTRVAGKGVVAEQAMVAPAENAAGTPARQRPAVARKTAAPEQAAAAQPQSARAERKTAAASGQPKTVTRSVLKLSSDDVAIDPYASFVPALKLSESLSESRDTGDAQKAAELKAAYERFAAILRGEDPVQNDARQLEEMRAKLQELESQTARIREESERQRQADQAALTTLRRDTVSMRWALALGVLLLAALAAIGWLYRRVREAARPHPEALWEKDGLDQSEPGEIDEWGNTLGVPGMEDARLERASEGAGQADDRPSDWERGIPMDDTLAVDWASRQGTLQSPPRAAPAAAKAAAPILQAVPALQVKITAPAIAARSEAGVTLMKAEEISDLMQEAEFWMLLNDPERAIDILEPCARTAHPVSPVPWIYLLDLYRLTGRKDQYHALAARIKRVFNTSATAWDEDAAAAPARGLRDYPHVVQTIEDLWEGDEIVPYLENLLIDEREGARAGFDLAVYREIIHLIGVARDPDAQRRREQLCFDQPQARLISQSVSMPPAAPSRAALPVAEDAADVFDRATSKQATARQLAANFTAPRQPVAESPVPVSAAPAVAFDPARAEPVAALVPQPEPEWGEAMPEEVMPEAAQVDAVAVAVLAPPAAAAAPAAMSAEDAEHMADMARKLDLVLAYQEIGEHVGARVLLEEVIQGGSPLQVEKARAMLKKLLKEIDWQ